jgi:uncharacterized protein YbgA (DUF1722 family)/uncharacterized protein YbbK (DUF523 family)
MRPFQIPNIVVSKCLGFAACRYNAAMIPDKFIHRLEPFVNFIQVCPEVEIGLPVPREPIKILAVKDKFRLVQISTGNDYTGKMHKFSNDFARALEDIDGFILKSRSPSCGIKDVKIKSGTDGKRTVGKGVGMFGGIMLERFPESAIEDEGRLNNFKIREHFLTKIFINARFRQVKKSGKMSELISFHAANKLLLMAYNQKQLRILGKITANQNKYKIDRILSDYQTNLHQAFKRLPRFTSNINVLMHAMGYFSEQLSREEKRYFLDLLDGYRNGQLPMSVLSGIIRIWIIKYKVDYLAGQTFFEPYPNDLVSITDSGKGRNF